MTLLLVVDDVPAMAEQYAYDLHRLGGHDSGSQGAKRGAAQEAAYRQLRREAAAHGYSGVQAS